MKDRVGWIDGMKGYACLIVLFGHSVACIFPNMFFGQSYQSHSIIEQFVHKSPLTLVYNSGQMNGIFFALSGWLIATKSVENNLTNRLITKYLKFVPMTCLGVFFAYLVMSKSLLYAHKLMDYSYAANYVGGANAFIPSVVGNNGFLRDALFSTFVNQSIYVGPLWFLTVIFWGSLLLESIEKCIDKRIVKSLIYLFLYVVVINLKGIDWRIPYMSFMFAGAIVAPIKFSKNMRTIPNLLLFAIGVYISASRENVGIYKPLSYIQTYLGMNLQVIGAILLIVAVSCSDKLQRVFDNKVGKWLAKYSLAIYVIHWSIVISVSCYVTYILYVSCGINHMISGTIGIVAGLLVTLLLAVIFTDDVYKPYCKVILCAFQKMVKNIKGDFNETKS